MFTGIIQEKGNFLRKYKGSSKYQLEIKAEKVLKDIKKGDSIAVNGVCLTAVDFGSDYFRADVMPETLKATNLGDLQRGSIVNLEQSLKPDDFIGGHFVTGHVDSIAVVNSIKSDANAKLVKLDVDPETEKFIDENLMSIMKPTACMLNLGRGGTVDEEALYNSLKNKVFRKYISDVFETEPLPEESPLWDLDNIIITPHICGPNVNYMDKAYDIVKENIEKYKNDKSTMINQYSFKKGY